MLPGKPYEDPVEIPPSCPLRKCHDIRLEETTSHLTRFNALATKPWPRPLLPVGHLRQFRMEGQVQTHTSVHHILVEAR